MRAVTQTTVLLLFVLTATFTVGCSSSSETADSSTDAAPTASVPATTDTNTQQVVSTVNAVSLPPSIENVPQLDRSVGTNVQLYPEVEFVTSHGNIRVRLNAKQAPVTVDNFLRNYVDTSFYSDTIFHYVDKGFILAGGGYTADYQAKQTRAEIFSEADNGLTNKRGTISMARHPEYTNSATSQFMFNLVDNASLDHKSADSAAEYGYCVFGEVVQGLEVLDKIAEVQVQDTAEFAKSPVQPVIVQSVGRVH